MRTDIERIDGPVRGLDGTAGVGDALPACASSIMLDYWDRQLRASPAAIELPCLRDRPTVLSGVRAQVSRFLPPLLVTTARDLCAQERTSLFVLIVAAFQTLLHRYSGQTDVIVGTPVDRGPFAALGLPLRADLSGDPPFRELMAQVHDVVSAARLHQHVAFEPPPLARLSVALGRGPDAMTLRAAAETGHRDDACLWIHEEADLLRVALDYETDLLDTGTAGRVLGHFRTLLEALVARPDDRLSELTMLTQPERHQLLIEWNPPRTEPAAAISVHELIDQQATRTPDARAVTTPDGTQLTYRELNTRADELACRLRRQDVGPETPVGLFTEPSVEMLVGILGILKTGAAFVPLNPSSSAQYVALVLEDTGASVIVAQQLVSRVRTKRRDGLSVVPTRPDRSRRPDSRRPEQAGGQNIACVMHRADREDAPLGVTLTHRNLLQSIHGRMAVYREPIETLLLLPSFAADQALPAIFWTLSTGGRLVLIPGADRDPSLVGRMLSRCQVSHIMGTPSLYARVLESTTARQLASLRAVIVGAEGCSASLGTRHRERAPRARLFAEYGRPECTFWSASCELSQVPDSSRAIGRAVANTQLYVLDGNLEPVPVGVPGELYVGGESVARGYLNRPALTRARFVRNVFSNASEACLFRTGDLVKYRHDGNLELVDRASASHQKAEQAAVISNEEGLW